MTMGTLSLLPFVPAFAIIGVLPSGLRPRRRFEGSRMAAKVAEMLELR